MSLMNNGPHNTLKKQWAPHMMHLWQPRLENRVSVMTICWSMHRYVEQNLNPMMYAAINAAFQMIYAFEDSDGEDDEYFASNPFHL